MQVEKLNISISKAVAGVIFIVGLTVNYYVTKSASERGTAQALYEIKLGINDLKREDDLIWQQLNSNTARLDRLENSIVSYIGKAVMPRETGIEQEKRRN